tara:strand:- start:27 stop:362 length:336 start_codon:yes stop_codon:yes gene_type:complete
MDRTSSNIINNDIKAVSCLKKALNEVQHVRGFAVKMLGATNHRSDRVRITDTRRGDTVVISYNSDYDSIKECAMEYLWLRGITIDSFTINEATKIYTINSNDFTTDLKEGK